MKAGLQQGGSGEFSISYISGERVQKTFVDVLAPGYYEKRTATFVDPK